MHTSTEQDTCGIFADAEGRVSHDEDFCDAWGCSHARLGGACTFCPVMRDIAGMARELHLNISLRRIAANFTHMQQRGRPAHAI